MPLALNLTEKHAADRPECPTVFGCVNASGTVYRRGGHCMRTTVVLQSDKGLFLAWDDLVDLCMGLEVLLKSLVDLEARYPVLLTEGLFHLGVLLWSDSPVFECQDVSVLQVQLQMCVSLVTGFLGHIQPLLLLFEHSPLLVDLEVLLMLLEVL